MIGGRRPLRGRKIGDRRVHIERPHTAYFRWSGRGTLTAKAAASAPTTALGRAWALAKGLAILVVACGAALAWGPGIALGIAALLLVVAVSTAAGVAANTSVAPAHLPRRRITLPGRS